jgi:hypothetical protein
MNETSRTEEEEEEEIIIHVNNIETMYANMVRWAEATRCFYA